MTRARAAADGNPWGLNAKEARVMDALAETGCNKGAARALGLSTKTIEFHAARVRQLMGCPFNRVLMVLQWDRWRQQQRAAVANPCTCGTPSGPAHCPEHADVAGERAANAALTTEVARLQAALAEVLFVLGMVDKNAGELGKAWSGGFVVEEVRRVLAWGLTFELSGQRPERT